MDGQRDRTAGNPQRRLLQKRNKNTQEAEPVDIESSLRSDTVQFGSRIIIRHLETFAASCRVAYLSKQTSSWSIHSFVHFFIKSISEYRDSNQLSFLRPRPGDRHESHFPYLFLGLILSFAVLFPHGPRLLHESVNMSGVGKANSHLTAIKATCICLGEQLVDFVVA